MHTEDVTWSGAPQIPLGGGKAVHRDMANSIWKLGTITSTIRVVSAFRNPMNTKS